MGVLNMINKKVLANSAMITAIWNETKKDNIELLKPFVIFLLGDNYELNDEIDCEEICIQMEKKFSFVNFPIAVLKKVFTRMKEYVYRKNNLYYLKKDIKIEYENFKEKHKKVNFESKEVVEALMEYLKSKGNRFKNLNYNETQNLFSIFLEENGFSGAYDIQKFTDIKRFKTSESNYFIAKYIIEENEKKSRIFDLIYKIICGFMLSNTIYMQLENNNNESLKKLDCFLDSPFILNVLGYKTFEQNKSAKRLIELLQEKKANIKCFRHNYDEVFNIIKNYKDNINKFKEKTLEFFDIQNYKETDVEIVLNNLEKIFKNNHIEIVETPDYNEYNPVFEEKELFEFLEENYNDKEEKITRIIEQDVKSISAVARLRKGIKYNKLEKCKAIFVTTSSNLIKHIDDFLQKKPFEEMGIAISDIELTTVLWLKTFKKNPDLPKIKLIENARTALEPSTAIMKNFKETLVKMQKSGIINDVDVIENIQEGWYNKSEEFMEKIRGNEDNINPQVIKGVFAKENDNLKQELILEKEVNKRLEKNIEEKQERIIKAKEKIELEYKQKAQKYSNIASKTINIITILLFIFLIIVDICYLINNVEEFTIFGMVFLRIIFEVLGLIDSIFPKFKTIQKFCNNKINKISERWYIRKIEEKKNKIPELFE